MRLGWLSGACMRAGIPQAVYFRCAATTFWYFFRGRPKPRSVGLYVGLALLAGVSGWERAWAVGHEKRAERRPAARVGATAKS